MSSNRGIKHLVEIYLVKNKCKNDEFSKILMELIHLKYHTIENNPLLFKPLPVHPNFKVKQINFKWERDSFQGPVSIPVLPHCRHYRHCCILRCTAASCIEHCCHCCICFRFRIFLRIHHHSSKFMLSKISI